MMLIVNRRKFMSALKARGYTTLDEFCRTIGVHRNSVSRYLSGAAVVPRVLEKCFEALDASPFELLIEKEKRGAHELYTGLPLLIEKLIQANPSIGLVLFGSRAKTKQRVYSDIDIGVVGERRLSIDELSRLLEIVHSETENWPYKVDLVDLGRASREFLAEVKKTARFLGGNPRYVSMLSERNERQQQQA